MKIIIIIFGLFVISMILLGLVYIICDGYEDWKYKHPPEKELKRRHEEYLKRQKEEQDWLDNQEDSKYECPCCKIKMKDISIATYGQWTMMHRHKCPKCHKVYEWYLGDVGKVQLYSTDMRSASAYGI